MLIKKSFTRLLNYYLKSVKQISYNKKCQKWDSNPRPQLWTRTLSIALRRSISLESGALDHSAILTSRMCSELWCFILARFIFRRINKLGKNYSIDLINQLSASILHTIYGNLVMKTNNIKRAIKSYALKKLKRV